MKWRQVLTTVQSIDSDEAKRFLATHAEGTYPLPDVRQPGEYEEERIPGAALISFPELSSRYKEIDREKSAIAYCAIGGRKQTRYF